MKNDILTVFKGLMYNKTVHNTSRSVSVVLPVFTASQRMNVSTLTAQLIWVDGHPSRY